MKFTLLFGSLLLTVKPKGWITHSSISTVPTNTTKQNEEHTRSHLDCINDKIIISISDITKIIRKII